MKIGRHRAKKKERDILLGKGEVIVTEQDAVSHNGYKNLQEVFVGRSWKEFRKELDKIGTYL